MHLYCYIIILYPFYQKIEKGLALICFYISYLLCIFVPSKEYDMRKILLMITGMLMFAACQESLEDRAVREAKEYTEKFCPTPVVNYTRTDSMSFDKPTKTYYYYCSLTENMKVYKEANFSFAYLLRSDKNPRKVYFQTTITPKKYKQ